MTARASTSTKSWFDKTYEGKWEPSCLEMVCDIWKLDAGQAIPDLLKLKDRLSDLKDYPLNDPLELARCYVDANSRLEAAEEKFRNTVAWRCQEGIDDLLRDYQPPSAIEEYYPSCFLEGYDREGDPIWIDRVGASDAWAVYDTYGHVPFRNYVLRNREMALRGDFARHYERQTGRPPARITAIMDMEGLCRRHLNAGLIAPLEEGIRNLQDHYGGMAKQIIVAKAPFVFRVVWSIAQHFCSESLKKSIIFGNARNTQAIVDKYMDRPVLPPAFLPKEGQGRPGLGFAQTSLQGGILPEDIIDTSSDALQIKTMGSNETVASCDSTTMMDTPTASPTSSWTKSFDDDLVVAERPVVRVKTTSLLSGLFLQGETRILLEF